MASVDKFLRTVSGDIRVGLRLGNVPSCLSNDHPELNYPVSVRHAIRLGRMKPTLMVNQNSLWDLKMSTRQVTRCGL